MRRALAFAIAALAALAVFALTQGEDESDGYVVRAIFDNASAIAKGEDVKVAGAVVGKVGTLDVTADRKAIVPLRITDARFTPFHADAHCTIRPEGLLAVKFVDCEPGAARQPELQRIDSDAGRGQHLLAVQRTSSPVDLDLVANVMRKPAPRQLAIFLSELGTGLAGREQELSAVIHRANPALGQTDRLLRVLAGENRRLAALARDADRVLGPLSARRREVAGFITAAQRTAAASARRSTQLADSIRRLPGVLRQLRPAMAELGALADQGSAVLADTRLAAPGLNRATAQLAPFARAGTPAVRSLGRLARTATPKLQRTRPLVRDLSALAGTLRSPAGNLDRLSASLKSKDAIRHFLDLTFYGTTAANGFDAVGHYARLEGLSGACSEYTIKGYFGCDAQWGPTSQSAKPITERATTPSGTTVAATRGADSSTLLDYLLGAPR